MRLYSSIALAAVAAVLVTPVAAEAKTKKHHVASPAAEGGLTTSEQLRLAQEQISQLQAQLNAISSKLDKAATQTDVAAANTAATTAATKADKALAAADAVKVAQVKTDKAVKAVDWAAGTKVGGQIFFNTSAITAKNSHGAAVERDGAFQIKRGYVSVEHTFNKTFAVNVTADIDPVLASKTVGNGSVNTPVPAAARTDQGFFVKYAYLQATIDPALVIKLGSAKQPWIPFVDDIEGHRYIDKNLVDQYGYGNSADWGVHVGGTLLNKIVSYDVAAVTGAGFRDPQNSSHVDLEGRVSASYLGFTAGVGGYTGKLAASDPVSVPNLTPRTASRINALVAYQGKLDGIGFTVGGEYLFAKNFGDKIVSGTSATDKARGEAIFASVQPIDKWSVFGRYNWVRSNALTAPAKDDIAYNVGVQYEPLKGLDLSLVYKHDTARGGFSGGNVASGQASRSEIGLYGNVKF